jgi:hypothetical protein
MGIPHYTNAEEPMAIFLARAESEVNNVRIGGGSSILNSSTEINFYTAANTTTTTGTVRMKIDSAGNVGIGTTTPSSILHINDASATTDGVYIEKISAIGKTALDVNHKTSVSTRTIAKFRNLTGTAFEILGDGTMNAPLGNIYFGSGFNGQTTGKINVDFGADTSGTALSLRGNGPVIVQTIHRTTGTASATPLSRVQYTNDVTTNLQIAEFGVLADNNIGGTPALRYMYMNPFATSSAWEGATLKVDFENRVGIGIAGTTRPTETLEVDGNVFLNGDNDKVIIGTGKDASIYYNGTNLLINPKEVGSGYLGILGNVNVDGLTASKVVFTDANKTLTSTGIGTSAQFIMGDGSVGDAPSDGTTYGRNNGAWVAAGGGTSDHSALSNLDYASAGHTGFKADTDPLLATDILCTQVFG